MPGPLASLKVLDFTALLPGPFATMALADMGAAVVRVESPTRPDMVRFLPPYDGDTSAWHSVLNRNKRSLALDLKQPGAAGVIRRLITTGGYDIVIEQFRPGVMERLGLGYESLRAAIVHRAATGAGQFVDISMLDMMLAWQAHLMSHHLVAAETPEPESMALNGGRAYDLYETADGRWLSVGSLEPKFWQGFCAAIDRPDLIAPGLSLDSAEQARVKAETRAAILTRPLAEWIAVFAPLDVCVEPVLTVPEALAQPHVAARGLVVDVPRPGGGTQRQIASPWRFSGGAAEYQYAGTALGSHTAEILREAGFTETEIENYQ